MELRRGDGPAGGSRMSPHGGPAGEPVVLAVECSVPQPIRHPARPRMLARQATSLASFARRPDRFVRRLYRNSVLDGPAASAGSRLPSNPTPLTDSRQANPRPNADRLN